MSEINDKIDAAVLYVVKTCGLATTYELRDTLSKSAADDHIARGRERGRVFRSCQRLRKKGLIKYNPKQGWMPVEKP